MAKIGRIQREEKVTKIVARYAEKRAALVAIVKDKNSTPEERRDAQFKLQKLPASSSRVRTKNRCMIDGRPRGYLRKYGMSRIWFRHLAAHGMLPGVVKASW